MRKVFRKYIIIIFGISIFFTIFLTSWWSYRNIISQEREIFKNISEHLKFNIEAWEKEREIFEEGLKKDYLLKAKLFREYIKYSPQIIDDVEKLNEIRELLAVNEVHVVDESGSIVGSSIPNYIGFNLNSDERLEDFIELLNSEDDRQYIFQQFEDMIKENGKPKYYLAMKRIDDDGIVQIGLFPRRLLAYRKNNIFDIGLDRTPVAEGNAIFILNKVDSSLLGGVYGKNLEVKEYIKDNSKDILEKILLNDKYIKILDKKYYVMYDEYKNYLIVRAVREGNLYREYLISVSLISISMLTILLILIFSLKKIIDRKILLEIEKVTKGLDKISQGNLNYSLEESNILEINKIVQAINSVIDFFSETSDKFEKIVKSLRIPVGMFFYLSDLNYLSISENIRELLKISNEKWKELKNDKSLWLSYLESLKKTNEEEEVCQLEDGNYVRVVLSKNLLTEEYFGIVQDVTKEEIHKKEILEKLEQTSQIAQKDYLTGVLKKEVGIVEVEKRLENSEGVFLIFDLDNFKKVNDTFGHNEGDSVLVEFANTLKEVFGEEAIISRMGGDEFSIFMDKKISLEEIDEILKKTFIRLEEKLKKYITECNFSMSIGGVILDKKYFSYEEIYHQADKGLYKAKRRGKKQYYIYNKESNKE